MAGVVYDTAALLAAEGRSSGFLALHDELTAARIRPMVPLPVLARIWRCSPQHQIARVLRGCDILPDDPAAGRLARLAYAARGAAAAVDALVLLTAVRHQAAVVTGDPQALTRLADAAGVRVTLFRP